MKGLERILLFLFLACGLAVGLVVAEEPDPPSVASDESETDVRWGDLGRFDDELRSALSRQDPAALSLLVQFPLKINHPDGSVILLENPRALQKRFQEVFPPDLRTTVIQHTSDDVVWRSDSAGLANGTLWVGLAESKAYLIQVVNLPEGKTPLPETAPELEFVCNSEKHRILIDSVDGKRRYRSWNKPHFPPEKPDMEIIPGVWDVQGTQGCASQSWTFTKGNATYAIGEVGCQPDVPAGAKARLEVTLGDQPAFTWWCY